MELGLTALSVGPRSTLLTFPVTTPVMMIPGTTTASRRWVGLEVSSRPEGPDLAGWVVCVGVAVFTFVLHGRAVKHGSSSWNKLFTLGGIMDGQRKQVIPE